MRAFIDEHREVHGVEPICRVLQIAPSGYRRYAAAVMEAFLGDRWYLFDSTGLAEVSDLVRIGTGRDASEVPFATCFGAARLRYTQALIAQMAQTAACKRLHTLDQQLCRGLLMSLDRLPSHELVMTQELIANMLRVRREGVTEAAGKDHRPAPDRRSRDPAIGTTMIAAGP